MSNRTIFVAVHTEYDVIDGVMNFIPCQVVENESGYSSMRGGPDQAPWYWGKTFEECQAMCDKYNDERGISPKEAAIIHASSFRASFKKKNKKPVCTECGSGRVLADAWAEWDEKEQDWVLRDVLEGNNFCENCEGECGIEWEELDGD